MHTPPDRDRYADLLRVVSIGLVVLGHWLAAVVLVRDGELVASRLHALVPSTQWGTWVFQVMPVFFIVGGFVNARSWSRAMRDEHSWSAWTRRRYQRLLVPLFPLVAFWMVLIPILLAVGLPRDSVQLANQAAFGPIWFLGVSLLVIALVPLTWALHRRFGSTAVVAFIAAAVVVDTLARAGIPVAGVANLWHMTAMILVAALTYVTGLWPYTSEIDASWWALRPPWLILCALLLAILVFFFRRFERAVPAPRPAPVRTLIGLGTTLAGITWLVQQGLYGPDTPWLLSVVVVGVLFGGLAALGALRPRPPSVGSRHASAA